MSPNVPHRGRCHASHAERAGLSAAPADAAPEVRSRVHWVSTAAAGRGAVREFIEMVLRARNQWDGIVRGYATAD